jgi:glycosyltransferase involved in cell wall biosynthesis
VGKTMVMMRVLFNCSTNFIGGGVQTASNFILHAIKDKDIVWYFAVSRKIFDELEKFQVDLQNFYVFDKSPSRNRDQKKKLYQIENEVSPDLVFTMSGPAYVKFNSIHILGCTDGYLTHANWLMFDWIGSFKPVLREFLSAIYKMYFFRWADHWIFQTEVARIGFTKRMCVSFEKTSVVSNACGTHYKDLGYPNIASDNEKLIIFVPSAGFFHKNLKIIPLVAFKLKELMRINGIEKEVEFQLTIHSDSELWKDIISLSKKYFVQDNVKNIGPFAVVDGPKLYQESIAVFLPTLLETFSGVFVESFATKTPLVVSDRDFARDICKDGALYFDPKSSTDAANKLYEVITMNLGERNSLLKKGIQVLNDLPSVAERYSLSKKVLQNIFTNKE